MNLLTITLSYIKEKFAGKALAITLMAFGVAIVNSVLLFTYQLEHTLQKNSANIDLVIGSKGSPLQIVLSSVYHIDFPTGNIPHEQAQKFAGHPLVKESLPLSMGDNYKGYRIIGTAGTFLNFYEISLSSGNLFIKPMDAVLGSNVAKALKMKEGDHFHSAHGFSEEGFGHDHHHFNVSGILNPTGAVTDNLIFTDLSSIWQIHDQEGMAENSEKEITSLLIRYKTPMATVAFPSMVNQSAGLQAASPAFETARLLSVFGTGIDLFKALGVVILLMAFSGVFISLYTSISERKYDLALIRVMGASRTKIFCLLLNEGIILSIIGVVAGILLSHLLLYGINLLVLTDYHISFTVFDFKDELWVALIGIGAGIAASIIPSIKAYSTDISDVLAKG
jgi:putative ABC transport system permease protein